MLCASHSGEAMHVQAAQQMLERTGQSYKALRCGCHVPYHFEIAGKTPGPLESFEHDRAALERLQRYCARPPFAMERLRLIAFITQGTQIRKILDHIGVDSEPPHISPARGPPL
jgi:hypothetical protein